MSRNLAVCGSQIKRLMPDAWLETVEIENLPVTFGLLHTPTPDFDRLTPANRFNVFVKIRAFSCNYRDKAFIITALKGGADSFFVLGSEFVAEVLDIGPDVTGLEIGDRVIANNHYRGGMSGATPPEGLPTNHASKEYQVFHQQKLIKIPPTMSDEVAAGFSIGAQTSYSMIRKLALEPGANVLVTAARSNTSLFAINALRHSQMNVYATTTSTGFEQHLLDLGVKEVIQVDPALPSFAQHPQFAAIIRRSGPFDGIIDPFFDLHLSKVVPVMGAGGRYITCGFYDQARYLLGEKFQPQSLELKTILHTVMVQNLHIIGNCIGVIDDLRQALDDYAADKLPVLIDSVFSGPQVGAFFHQTFSAKERLGKVIYQYD